MSVASKLVGGVVAVLITVALAGLSRWPVSAGSEQAIIRLSWRTEPVRVEECRTLSEEELARVPAHMRVAQECTGYFADYALTVQIDDRSPTRDTLSPSGLRHDRPVYVLHDEPVEPGTHRVTVTFAALVPPGFESDHPLLMRWSDEVTLGARQAALLTLDAAGREFVRR